MNLVIFDVDGTLIDSQHMIVSAMEHAFEVNGLVAPSRDEIRPLSVFRSTRPCAPFARKRRSRGPFR